MPEVKRQPARADDSHYDDDPLVELARLVSGGQPFPEAPQRRVEPIELPPSLMPQSRGNVTRQPMPNQLSALEQELFSELRSTVDPDRAPRARVEPTVSAPDSGAPKVVSMNYAAERSALDPAGAGAYEEDLPTLPIPSRQEPRLAAVSGPSTGRAQPSPQPQRADYDPSFEDFFDDGEVTLPVAQALSQAQRRAMAEEPTVMIPPAPRAEAPVRPGARPTPVAQAAPPAPRPALGDVSPAEPRPAVRSQATPRPAPRAEAPVAPPSGHEIRVDGAGNGPRPTFEDFAREEIAAAAREAEPFHEDRAYVPDHVAADQVARRHLGSGEARKGFLVAGVALGVFVLGGLGFLGWRAFGGADAGGGTPPLILADARPMKVKPTTEPKPPSGPNLTVDKVEDKSRLVTRQEDPVDQVTSRTSDGRTVRVIAPGTPGAAGAEQPRTVRTVVVRPDGTIVPSGDAARPAPVQTIPIRTTEVAPAAPAPGPAVSSTSMAPPISSAAPTSTASVTPAPQAAATPSAALAPSSAQPTPVKTVPVQPVAVAPRPAAPPPVAQPAAAPAPVAQVPAAPPRAAAPAPVAQAPAPAPVVRAPAPPPAPATGAPLALGPVAPTRVATAAPTPVAPAPVAAAPVAAPSSGGGGDFVVQLSSQRSDADARRSFADMQRRYPDLLGGKSLDVQAADLGARGTYYRARAVAGSREAAVELCQQIKAKGGDCVVGRR